MSPDEKARVEEIAGIAYFALGALAMTLKGEMRSEVVTLLDMVTLQCNRLAVTPDFERTDLVAMSRRIDGTAVVVEEILPVPIDEVLKDPEDR